MGMSPGNTDKDHRHSSRVKRRPGLLCRWILCGCMYVMNVHVYVGVYMYVCACVCLCVHVCMYHCTCECLHICTAAHTKGRGHF